MKSNPFLSGRDVSKGARKPPLKSAYRVCRVNQKDWPADGGGGATRSALH